MQVGRVVGGCLCCLSGVGSTHDDALCQPLEACCAVVAPVAGGMRAASLLACLMCQKQTVNSVKTDVESASPSGAGMQGSLERCLCCWTSAQG
jgi:hypothetical protein